MCIGKLVKYDEVIAILGNQAESYVLASRDADYLLTFVLASHCQSYHLPYSLSSATLLGA